MAGGCPAVEWFRPSGTQARYDAPPHAASRYALLATKYGLNICEQHRGRLPTRVVRLIWPMGVRVRRDSLCPVVVLWIKLLLYMSTRICSCSDVMSVRGYTGQRAGDKPNHCRSLSTIVSRSRCANSLVNATVNSYRLVDRECGAQRLRTRWDVATRPMSLYQKPRNHDARRCTSDTAETHREPYICLQTKRESTSRRAY